MHSLDFYTNLKLRSAFRLTKCNDFIVFPVFSSFLCKTVHIFLIFCVPTRFQLFLEFCFFRHFVSSRRGIIKCSHLKDLAIISLMYLLFHLRDLLQFCLQLLLFGFHVRKGVRGHIGCGRRLLFGI